MTVYDSRNDKQLMDRISRGDQNAFQNLFDQLSNDVLKLSYSLLMDQQIAEDATQEAFIRLWKNAANWKPEASVKTWLFTIARNHCFDLLRKKKRDLKKNIDIYEDHLSSSKEIENKINDTSLDHKKYHHIIKNALFTLPERQREAITLVYYMEMQNSDAARMMDLGASAFDSLLARARRNLRLGLKSEDDLLQGYFIHGTE